MSERQIDRHLKVLAENGFIVRTTAANAHPNRKWADVYALNLASTTAAGESVDTGNESVDTASGPVDTSVHPTDPSSTDLPSPFRVDDSGARAAAPLSDVAIDVADCQLSAIQRYDNGADYFEMSEAAQAEIDRHIEDQVAPLRANDLSIITNMLEMGCRSRQIIGYVLKIRR